MLVRWLPVLQLPRYTVFPFSRSRGRVCEQSAVPLEAAPVAVCLIPELEIRLRKAQAVRSLHHLISCLISDELAWCASACGSGGKGMLFRDSQRPLDNLELHLQQEDESHPDLRSGHRRLHCVPRRRTVSRSIRHRQKYLARAIG